MSEVMDAEALKKAEKERRRAEYAGKTFEKAPKQSQKEKNKEKKATGGGDKDKPPANKVEGKERRNSIDASNSSNIKNIQSNTNHSKSVSNSNIQQNMMGKSRLALFDHLDRKKPISSTNIDGHDRGENIYIHPAVVRLGLKYRNGVVLDDDERVTALILAFYQVIEDYTTPPLTQLKRDLDKHIRNQVQHLVDCRQHSMGMGNVIKYIRHLVTDLG